jgi:hypothetical protein
MYLDPRSSAVMALRRRCGPPGRRRGRQIHTKGLDDLHEGILEHLAQGAHYGGP